MIPQNTFEILQTLQKNDLKAFGNFLISPYLNSNKALITLFNELKKFHPVYSNEKLSYEYLYKKLYPGKKFSERTIKNRLTEFAQLLKNFLANERFKKSRNEYYKMLVKELQSRKSFALANKIIGINKAKLEEEKISPEFFMHRYALEEMFHYNSLQLSEVHRNEKIAFSAIKSEPLLAHFFATFFVNMSEHITYYETRNFSKRENNILDEFIKIIHPEDFLNYLEAAGYKYFPYIKAYYLTYKIKSSENTAEVYKELKAIFMNHAGGFEESDVFMLWAVLCETLYLKLIPHDVSRYRREVFELNDYFLKLEVYPNKKEEYMTPQIFENIFSSAIIAGELEWSENFINKYGPMLHPGTRQNQVNYCLGVLNFKLKKYEKSLIHIGKVNYTDIVMKINLRFYTLLNYIEMKHYESALSMIDSAKHFTDSNEKIPQYLTGYMKTSLKVFKRIILAESQVKELDEYVLQEALAAHRFFQKAYAVEKIRAILKQQERNVYKGKK